MLSTAPVLALDTSSPEVSVAVAGDAGGLLALRTMPQRRSSGELLGMVEEALAEAGTPLAELAGVIALRGPGSFTGLRVGLATVLGFHQALGLPATAVPTLEMLAVSVPGGPRTLTLVHALRQEWYGQLFGGDPPHPLAPPERLALPARLTELAPARCVGHGLETLAQEQGTRGLGIPLLPPGEPLAAVAARWALRHPLDWDPSLLSSPLYLAPPPATPPTAPKPVLPPWPGSR